MAAYLIHEALVCVWGAVFLKKGLWNGQADRHKKALFTAVCFGQMFLLSCFRSQIGFDYFMYSKGFLLMDMEGFSSLSYLDWEVGFVVFTKVIGLFTNNILVYHGIISALCLFAWAYFIFRYSKNVWLSIILFQNLYFFYLNMNFLRQALAISISLFAWPFLKERKFWKFLAIVIAASLFHTTALILIPLYFLVRFTPGAGLCLLYGYGLLFFYISSEGILNLLTMVFHEEYANSVFLQGMSPLYGVLPVLLAGAALLFRGQLLRAVGKEGDYLTGMLFFSAFCMVMMTRHAILERLSYYSWAYAVIALPCLVKGVRVSGIKPLFLRGTKAGMNQGLLQPHYQKQAVLVLLGIVGLTMMYHIFGMLENVHGVFPYQWIFAG